MTAEERKNTPPNIGDENSVFADGAETSASLRAFEDGQRFVEVDVDQAQFDGLTPKEKRNLARSINLKNSGIKL